jgi:hypothetical protein
MKKKLLLAGILLPGFIIIILIFVLFNTPINSNEFELASYASISKDVPLFPHSDKMFQYYVFYTCADPGLILKLRCSLRGGEVTSKATSIGFGANYTLGCYPFGKITDGGKKCKSNNDCQGECNWFGGDLVFADSSKTCSNYKKPYFIYNKNEAGSLETCKQVYDNLDKNRKIFKQSADQQARLETAYQQLMRENLRDYWHNNNLTGLTDKLITIISPIQFHEMHYKLVRDIAKLEYNSSELDFSKDFALEDLNAIKLQYPWLVDSK